MAHDEASMLMRKKVGVGQTQFARAPLLDTSSPRYLSGLSMGSGSGVVL